MPSWCMETSKPCGPADVTIQSSVRSPLILQTLPTHSTVYDEINVLGNVCVSQVSKEQLDLCRDM